MAHSLNICEKMSGNKSLIMDGNINTSGKKWALVLIWETQVRIQFKKECSNLKNVLYLGSNMPLAWVRKMRLSLLFISAQGSDSGATEKVSGLSLAEWERLNVLPSRHSFLYNLLIRITDRSSAETLRHLTSARISLFALVLVKSAVYVYRQSLDAK